MGNLAVIVLTCCLVHDVCAQTFAPRVDLTVSSAVAVVSALHKGMSTSDVDGYLMTNGFCRAGAWCQSTGPGNTHNYELSGGTGSCVKLTFGFQYWRGKDSCTLAFAEITRSYGGPSVVAIPLLSMRPQDERKNLPLTELERLPPNLLTTNELEELRRYHAVMSALERSTNASPNHGSQPTLDPGRAVHFK